MVKEIIIEKNKNVYWQFLSSYIGILIMQLQINQFFPFLYTNIMVIFPEFKNN